MDNNQPNPWQPNSTNNPNSQQPRAWGGGWSSSNQQSAQSLQLNQPNGQVAAPPTYQPPVGYGPAIGASQPQPTVTTPIAQSTMVGSASSMSQQSVQSFGNQASYQSVGVQNPQVQAPTQPQPQLDKNSTKPPKVKQPMSRNQVLLIVTGIVTVVVLSIIVICVVLVMS